MIKLGVQIVEKDRKPLQTKHFLNRLKDEPYAQLGVERHRFLAEQGESHREATA